MSHVHVSQKQYRRLTAEMWTEYFEPSLFTYPNQFYRTKAQEIGRQLMVEWEEWRLQKVLVY